MTNVYMPQVHGNAAIAGQGEPQPMNRSAFWFAFAWLKLLGDRAKLMRADDRLVEAAQLHAEWLAPRLDNTASNHIGAGGSMPNQRVRAAGFRLLDWHLDGNTVESLVRTWEDIDEDMPGIVYRLMQHEAHHDHLWGIGWFSGHIVYGIGAAAEPSGSWTFVVDCCPPEQVT